MFSNGCDLKAHIVFSHSKKYYQCFDCRARYTTREKLEIHFVTVHERKLTNVSIDEIKSLEKAREDEKIELEENVRKEAEGSFLASVFSKAQTEAEEAKEKAKTEADEMAKRKADEKAKKEAKEKAKIEAEEKAKRKAKKKAKIKAELKAKQKAEKKAKIEAEENREYEANRKAEEKAKLEAEKRPKEGQN